MLYLVIFLFLLILIILTTILKVKIVVEYIRSDYDDNISLSFFTLGELIKFKYEIPLFDLDKTGIKFSKIKKKGRNEKIEKKEKDKFNILKIFEKIKSFKTQYDENKNVIGDIKKYLKNRVVLKEFRIESTIGTGDSYYTGILCGLAWMVAGIILSYAANSFKTIKKHVSIQSDFKDKKFNIDIFCIFSIRIVHIIVVRLMLFLGTLKKKKLKQSKEMIGGDVVG